MVLNLKQTLWVYVYMYHIYIDMQEKLLSVIYKLNITELFVKFAFILRVSECLQGAFALNVCYRSPKFDHNIHQVVLNRYKNQIYVTIIIMVTIAIWMTRNYPYPQSSLFWADNLRPYRAKCITQCFSLGDYFQPHFCHEVSDMHLHILAINTA